MELVQLLALAAFVAIVAALFIAVRRTGRLIAASRETDTFRRSMTDIATRAGASLEGVAGRVDAVRRRALEAEAIGQNIEAAHDALGRYVEEAGRLRGSPAAIALRDDMVAELERASRALDMIEHGRTIMLAGRGRERELEAQTSLKRGYLNLRHAREAIERHAAEARRLADEESASRRFQRRNA